MPIQSSKRPARPVKAAKAHQPAPLKVEETATSQRLTTPRAAKDYDPTGKMMKRLRGALGKDYVLDI